MKMIPNPFKHLKKCHESVRNTSPSLAFEVMQKNVMKELICSFFVASWTRVVKYHGPLARPKQINVFDPCWQDILISYLSNSAVQKAFNVKPTSWELYRKQCEKKLAQNGFNHVTSINPSLALPWASMPTVIFAQGTKPNEAFDCCLIVVRMLPVLSISFSAVECHYQRCADDGLAHEAVNECEKLKTKDFQGVSSIDLCSWLQQCKPECVCTTSNVGRALASGIINEDEVVIYQPIGTLKYPGVAKGLYVASPSGFSLHNHMKPALSRFLREMYKKLNSCPSAMIYRLLTEIIGIENVNIAYALTFTCF
ncbi:tetratricopeptide repeat (TPR)-like superfamily protein [Artemisia annua]|uniref:Tetratricopeptide repeat (TPR)-like superfamily protein n=1 Tax=Artemisia annua TaxID=35608 RepID=A0A2U1MQP1_ARTAN|nr:tetratricopeptide repeat (TPR)-like superfamily protein [Artemisia annua]